MSCPSLSEVGFGRHFGPIGDRECCCFTDRPKPDKRWTGSLTLLHPSPRWIRAPPVPKRTDQSRVTPSRRCLTRISVTGERKAASPVSWKRVWGSIFGGFLFWVPAFGGSVFDEAYSKAFLVLRSTWALNRVLVFSNSRDDSRKWQGAISGYLRYAAGKVV